MGGHRKLPQVISRGCKVKYNKSAQQGKIGIPRLAADLKMGGGKLY
jgi:hypothetical protein